MVAGRMGRPVGERALLYFCSLSKGDEAGEEGRQAPAVQDGDGGRGGGAESPVAAQKGRRGLPHRPNGVGSHHITDREYTHKKQT